MLKMRLSSLEGLSEEIKSLYTKVSDTDFRLSIDESELKNAYTKQKDTVQELKNQLETSRKIIEESKKGNYQEVSKLQAKLAEYEESTMSLDDKYKKAFNEKENLLKQFEDFKANSDIKLEDYKLNSNIRNSLLKFGAENDSNVLDFLSSSIKNRARFDNESKSFLFLDKDEKSYERREKESGNWVNLTQDDIISEMIDSGNFDKFFNKEVKKGFNTNTNLSARARLESEIMEDKISKAKTPEDRLSLMFQRG